MTRFYNAKFYYIKPDGIFDPENYGVKDSRWDEKWSQFFNFQENEACDENTQIDEIRKVRSIKDIPKLKKKYEKDSKNYLFILDGGEVKEWVDKNIQALSNSLEALWEKYERTKKPTLYFEQNALTVALHVRRFSKADTDPNPIRAYYDPNQGKNSYYYKMIEAIENAFRSEQKTIHYHIYTQGDLKDFKTFYKIENVQRERLFIHTDESPLEAIHHMANADIFVMARSSMSWVTMVYAKNKVISQKGFWHNVLPNVFVVDEKKINKNRIMKYVRGQKESFFKRWCMKIARVSKVL
jgi:hypothetical protein